MGAYDITVGTPLVGVFLNTYLYGLVTYQFAAYHRTEFNDPPTTKYMVLFLFILDTSHSVVAIYSAWYYVVMNHNNPTTIGVDIWATQFTPIGIVLAAFVTQIFLGFRIRHLTRSKFLCGVVIVLAVSSFFLSAACGIEVIIINQVSELTRITPLVVACLSMEVVVDTFITITLIVIFSRWRGGFRKTDTILNRLIRGAIQTGLFAGIFNIGLLITFAAVPNTNLYRMFAVPIGRIYTNTLMDTLLTRESIKSQLVNTHEVNGTSDSIDFPPAGSSESQLISAARSASIETQVRRSIQEMHDLSSREHVEGKTAPLASAV